MTNSQEKNSHEKTIGGRIKFLRESNSYNQTQFAEKIGVQQSFISKVEKNIASFTVDQIILLKTFFDFDLNWLLTGGVKTFVAEERSVYGKADPVTEKINQHLEQMDEEAKRDVLKYAEEKKLLRELMAERQKKRG